LPSPNALFNFESAGLVAALGAAIERICPAILSKTAATSGCT